MSRYSNSKQVVINQSLGDREKRTMKKRALVSANQVNPSIFIQSPFTYYMVKDTDTVEGIAHDYYGRADAFDIIMLANNLFLPTDVYPGKILIIPLSLESAYQSIAALNASKG